MMLSYGFRFEIYHTLSLYGYGCSPKFSEWSKVSHLDRCTCTCTAARARFHNKAAIGRHQQRLPRKVGVVVRVFAGVYSCIFRYIV